MIVFSYDLAKLKQEVRGTLRADFTLMAAATFEQQ
jgi:hypothetical protein